MISLVVAADEHRAIGAKGRIPWRLRDDLVRLKELTVGHVVILGRKTYDSMAYYYSKSGRPMPGSMYIVVTRNPAYAPSAEGVKVAHAVDEALRVAHDVGDGDVFIIGGGEIFTQALPSADTVYYTEVKTMIDNADAFFPPLEPTSWREISREHHQKDARNEFAYDFVTYQRIR